MTKQRLTRRLSNRIEIIKREIRTLCIISSEFFAAIFILTRVFLWKQRYDISLIIIMSLIFYFGPRELPDLFSFEHWSSDYRTALFSNEVKCSANADAKSSSAESTCARKHPDITIIEIDEASLATMPYRSPVDREILAETIDKLTCLNAKVIGLDVLIDTKTEKDNALLKAIRNSQRPVVMASLSGRATQTKNQKNVMNEFIKGARDNLHVVEGAVEFDADPDDVVREVTPVQEDGTPSFSAALAHKMDRQTPSKKHRIAWLRSPTNASSPFNTIPLVSFLHLARSTGDNFKKQIIDQAINGKAVLIGGTSLKDDGHETPFSVDPRFDDLTPGVVIHAQILAQYIDGRHKDHLSPGYEFLLLVLSATAGIAIARLNILAPLQGGVVFIASILLICVGVFVFVYFDVILPTLSPIAALDVSMVVVWFHESYERIRIEVGG